MYHDKRHIHFINPTARSYSAVVYPPWSPLMCYCHGLSLELSNVYVYLLYFLLCVLRYWSAHVAPSAGSCLFTSLAYLTTSDEFAIRQATSRYVGPRCLLVDSWMFRWSEYFPL